MFLPMTQAHEAASAYLTRDVRRGYASAAQCDGYHRRSAHTITCNATETDVSFAGAEGWTFAAKLVVTRRKDGKLLVRMAYWDDGTTFYYTPR